MFDVLNIENISRAIKNTESTKYSKSLPKYVIKVVKEFNLKKIYFCLLDKHGNVIKNTYFVCISLGGVFDNPKHINFEIKRFINANYKNIDLSEEHGNQMAVLSENAKELIENKELSKQDWKNKLNNANDDWSNLFRDVEQLLGESSRT